MKFITKWRFIVAVVGTLAVCIYILVRQMTPVVESNSAHPATNTTQTKNTPIQSATASSTTSMGQVIEQSEEQYNKTELLYRANMELVARWEKERRMSPDNAPEYKSYSNETLEKLAQGGDIIALTTLADRYELQRDPVSQDKAEAARTKAIILGSTYALGQESTHYESAAFLAKDPAQAKANIMHSMALKKVGVLRGDPLDYLMDLRSPEYKNQKFDLNENDFIQINSAAQKIYGVYQTQRQALGLGDFDNSVPEIVRESYDRMDPRKEGVKGY